MPYSPPGGRRMKMPLYKKNNGEIAPLGALTAGEGECDTTMDEEETNLVPILMSDYYKSFK